ncbi:MAG: hypothetical protein Q9227_005658 [Pyrenula ochraceoflavens]
MSARVIDADSEKTGFDPINKREIPRSYVFWLENRIAYLELLLEKHHIEFQPPEAFESSLHQVSSGSQAIRNGRASFGEVNLSESPVSAHHEEKSRSWEREQDEKDKLNKLVDNVGMVSVQGASDPRWLGSASGISFARVVFAAIKSSMSTNSTEKGSVKPSKLLDRQTNGSSMRESFFGLHTRPTMNKAPFPARHLGQKLVSLYFEHANPQIPILHRGEFMALFDRCYEAGSDHCSPRELYILNIVFAIGAGIIFGSSDGDSEFIGEYDRDTTSPSSKKVRLSSQQHQPEEYHASAIVHLESILGSSNPERSEGLGGGLEELQAVLLLASFALLRPVAPGLFYIVGVALRLAIDLGLHFEAGADLDVSDGHERPSTTLEAPSQYHQRSRSVDAREKGRREWMRDLRRRLFWCTYCFDRLICTCVGRPLSLSDNVITTQFPCLLDDNFITKDGILDHNKPKIPSYKYISFHYLRLRLLQSEILQVLQCEQAKKIRSSRFVEQYEFTMGPASTSFMDGFDSFRSWRKDIDRRLWEWKCSAPLQEATGVQFEPKFLELNYWQAVIMLYRQSLTVPETLRNEISPSEDVSSPFVTTAEEKEDEDDIFLKVAEAGQKVLRLYRELHRLRLVNYTYLATHHLFMAGISFLYAIWHSPLVRSRLTIDDVDFTILAATSVLGDLTEKCPPAEACKDAFARMSKATVQMGLSTTGFGSQVRASQSSNANTQHRPSMFDAGEQGDSERNEIGNHISSPSQPSRSRRPPPRFDMDLRDLFPDDMDYDLPSQSLSNSLFTNDFRFGKTSSYPRTRQEDVPLHVPDFQSQYLPSQLNTQINQGFGVGTSVGIQSNSVEGLSQVQQAPYYQGQGFDSNASFPPPSQIDFLGNYNQNAGFDADGEASSAINFDFGMGVDAQHDWNDGNQLDIFDGFFFGSGMGNHGT